MKGRSQDEPVADEVLSPWRKELVALLKPEENDLSRSFNAGIRAALTLLTRHEQERQQRSKSVLRQMKAEMKKIGGDMPYGCQLAADGETLIENPDEQRVIVKARKLRPNHSLRGVARELRKAKMFPRNHDPADPRTPSVFQAVQILRMLGEDK